MNFQIPINLDLTKLILDKPTILLQKRTTINGKRKTSVIEVKSSSLIKHIPYCYYLIDLIITRSLLIKDNVNGYVNLRGELLDKVIPHHTRLLVTNLLTYLNVIQVNDQYSFVDHYSKAYRLTSTYSITDLKTIEVDSKKGTHIVEPILGNTPIKGTHIVDTNNKDIQVGYGNPYVGAFLKRVKRVDNGKNRLKKEKTNDLLQLHEYEYQLKQVYDLNLDYDQIAEDGVSHPNLTNLIRSINEGNESLSINVNNQVNRVFSPITSLKKEHRKYLLDKEGNTMLSIDFKTSHLFHLIKLISDLKEADNALKCEIEKIRQLALTDIYEYVRNKYSEVHCDQIDRQHAKDLFIKSFLYGMYPNRKLSIWVKSLFPLTNDYIRAYGRRKLSIDLQRSESKLLNNKIFKRIAEEQPAAVAYGLFDSILVDENHFDQVFNIMYEESEKFFGYVVPLTTDDLVVTK